MNLTGILPFARMLLERCVPKGGVVIDGTAGNGHDTVFLAKLVGECGTVYSFDIQKDAIDATTNRIHEHGYMNRVKVIHDGHENVEKHLQTEHHFLINGAIFNLGYLPGSDKTIITTPETTISSIEQILPHLKPGGIIVLVVYHGHPAGAVERDELLPFVRSLAQEKYHVLEYRFTNQRNNPPFIIAIEKRK
ncbi:tRNA (mnm(5)s(2)U34)-methyltransferase [Evansella tamaricis]|uniref:Class I SAM-dependent methyltransferase n=1 Tax=Evansella tamaricis TaxID=2069301 RepID=A0ABS6JMX1_9BACI|nr:class I SAM-dependent methyltransferase [Evansella tamaricis]MBU9713765.1 class I SAM-dependent methyltransferase [Evansella tamaricis]